MDKYQDMLFRISIAVGTAALSWGELYTDDKQGERREIDALQKISDSLNRTIKAMKKGD